MSIVVREQPMTALADHQRISIAFEVVGRYDPETRSIESVEAPYTKDYDAVEGAGSSTWRTLFDFTNWGLVAAYVDGEHVGGAVITRDTANMYMLDGRVDLAFLLDLRVDPGHRSTGVGRALMAAVEAWAVEHGCIELKIETQDINSTACAFYEAVGMSLAEVDPDAYPELPDETQVIWRKHLGAR